MVIQFPLVKQNKEKAMSKIGEDSANNTKEKQMIYVIFEDGLYMFNAMELADEECYDYQIFGLAGCRRCEKKLKDCNGSLSKELGINSLGNKIPLATKIGDRERRYDKNGNLLVDFEGGKDGKN